MRAIRPAIRFTAALIVLLGLGLLLLTCFVTVVHIVDDSQGVTYSPQPVFSGLVQAERIFPGSTFGVSITSSPQPGQSSPAMIPWIAVVPVIAMVALGAFLVMLGGVVFLLAARRRQRSQNPAEDEQSMRELYQRAMRMEERMEALETLLLQQSRHEVEWSARP